VENTRLYKKELLEVGNRLMSRKAMYFEKIENGKVHCYLCPHNCIISPEKVGMCRVRQNIDGELYSLNYGKITSIALDPIEKKPLYHFHPGSKILSAGTFGCNLKCSFCQNWTIAHDIPESFEITPSRLVQETEKNVSEGNIGIAYTYNEPSIWYEFVYETSKLIKGKGLLNVLVTNGFINSEPLENLMPYIDAMNIDVKAFNSSFYKDVCKGDGALEYIKSTIEQASQKCHLEVTTLVIPELNDSMDEIGELAKWLASISKDIVLHLSRYFPNYRMNKPATPLKTLNAAAEKASHYLRYVYLGNV